MYFDLCETADILASDAQDFIMAEKIDDVRVAPGRLIRVKNTKKPKSYLFQISR